MVISGFKYIFAPLLTLFIILSSMLLNKTPNLTALLLTGCVFVASVILDKKIPRLQIVQILFLGVFHWFSHLNWSLLLYYLLIFLAIEKRHHYAQSLPIALLVILQYTLIRLTYVPNTYYNLLVSLFDFIGAVVVILFFHYILSSESEKKRLREQNDYLATHDPLTNLLNYEGLLHQLDELILTKRPFALVLLDLQDFKSSGQEITSFMGYTELTGLSNFLNVQFTDAYSISRYAGNRFAILLPPREDIEGEIKQLLDSNILEYHVNFSITLCPKEADSTQLLISIGEHKLFQYIRKLWLKREEEMFNTEKMKVVGELAAGMAHEIRNPLTAIKGFIQISKQHEYNIHPWYDVIMSEITRMSELTAEFLQFSKPHISNMKPESISNCIERVCSLTESDAVYRGHTLTIEDAPHTLPVYMDRDKIVQVLLNLVRNAFEAMSEPGYVHIRIQQNQNMAVIEIEDTGNGILENDMHRIFYPFYTTKETGTGLGLSICQKIAEDHGGLLEARSEVGKGSVFSLQLPVYVPPAT